MPRHIAIIPDGNGRWAKEKHLPRIEGHRQGVENIRLILDIADEYNIRWLTFYAFSVENRQRPQKEINSLMSLLLHFLKKHTSLLVKKKIRLQTIGAIEELPEKIQLRLQETIQKTQIFTDRTFVLALNYGSRNEVLHATRSYLKAVQKREEKVDSLNWEKFQEYLYTANMPDPDLIIRTSGETRLSNFLLLQAAYAEYYFSPVYWPEFGREDFLEAIASFKRRQRRFGLTGDQLSQ